MPETPQSLDKDDLDFIKLDRITMANRAPTSTDKGMLWIKFVPNNDATITLYIRHKYSGAWRSKDFT